MRIAIASSGLGHIARGIETWAGDTAVALSCVQTIDHRHQTLAQSGAPVVTGVSLVWAQDAAGTAATTEERFPRSSSLLKNINPIQNGSAGTPRPTEIQEISQGRAKPPAEPGVVQQAACEDSEQKVTKPAKAGHQPVNTFTLYAYSNAGSLLGLVSYPFLVEPTLSLSTQIVVWAATFILYLLAFLWITIRHAAGQSDSNMDRQDEQDKKEQVSSSVSCKSCLSMLNVVQPQDSERFLQNCGSPRICGIASSCETSASLNSSRFLQWVGLATIPSLMLLAVTTQLTVNVAPIPLLWMLPLALYLISFMICFSGAWKQRDDLLGLLVLLAVIGCAVARTHETEMGVIGSIGIFCAGLLVASVFCHGALYARRPPAGHITRFYFAVALGGVLGGIVAGILAPMYFKDYWELPLTLAIFMILVLTLWWRSQAAWLKAWRLPLFVIGAVALILIKQSGVSGAREDRKIELESQTSAIKNPPEVMMRQRNFYGVLRVMRQAGTPGVNVYSLMHGDICHGYQYDFTSLRLRPTTYYAEATGVGMVMKAMQNQTLLSAGHTSGIRMGGLGMGIGTIAAYGREGDELRFFEINPAVIRLATNAAPFTYIHDSAARVDIVEGDARMSLKREQQTGVPQYDLLVLDTFSGDSIPVHCLTKEAFELYLSRLKPGGVMAAHISNRYLDLSPVFAAIKRQFGLEGTVIITKGDMKISLDAMWVVLSRSRTILEDPELKAVSRPEMDTCKPIRLWTDDFSNLLDVLVLHQKVYSLTPKQSAEKL